jgi:hypothetical protein
MQHYTSVVTHKQAGYWRLELRPKEIKPQPAKKTPAPLSIQQFLRSLGGIDPNYNRGQWRHECDMIRDAGRQGVQPGLFNKRSLLTFEQAAEYCQEAGYITDPDVDMMLWALAKDVEATLVGERRNRVYGFSGPMLSCPCCPSAMGCARQSLSPSPPSTNINNGHSPMPAS